jgi:catalase
LQGRLFSYTDTQISRLGGPNFHEIPINRPTCPYHNFQRDGMHRQDIDTNPANYEPNSINDNWPRETPPGRNAAVLSLIRNVLKGQKSVSEAHRSANITRILACSGTARLRLSSNILSVPLALN